jgi:hypothetical protein
MPRTLEELSQQLADVAKALQASGALPQDLVVNEIQTSCRSFHDLRDKSLELVDLLTETPTTSPTEAMPRKGIETLLQFATEAQRKSVHEEKSRVRAMTILDRILSLIHRDHADFFPLHEVQMKAKALRDKLKFDESPEAYSEATLLAQGRHPLAELLTLVEGHKDLEDDLWLLLKHAVEESFGKTLAMSAARGKLGPSPTRFAVAHSMSSHGERPASSASPIARVERNAVVRV